ncbi:ABC-type transport system periplasmic component [Altererythrobacter epoxidivorans]|uniref:ABC-type transport system periplasmic component n=1 Tax=Altererythrobacter epoxidivorans TaxID=361183 RepID=A0A0M4MUN9_9SPHN|nr:MlaD family protein [Altererythrobacter epoxidivorans]ALE17258.1 ABC-type transport system periplasmic component [Altererythrobacter epoxidivorans]
METRANHLWVGAVTLVLLALLAGFIVWLARLGQGEQSEYDILFQQSVSGLARGSEVSFAGVPVGQVSEIRLYEKDPDFVRVRVAVREDVPILVGTTATIQGSFTGVSTILLDGARAGAPAITCETTACPEGKPVIPPKDGGLNALLSDAPLLLERLATLTERLTELLSDDNQASIAGILRNTNRMTDSLADAAPQMERTLAELQVTLREASEALDSFEKVTQSTDQLLNKEGASLADQLRVTLKSANDAAKSLSSTLEDTRPAARQLSESTLPAAEATLQDLRATSKALRNVTEKLENQGAGAVLKGQSLPDYKP